MKKLVLMAMAAVALAMPAANAQKVNQDAARSKMAKSDAEIADAKKNGKAATWINRGKIYFDAYAEPTKDLFPNAPEMTLQLTMGKPVSVEEGVLGGSPVIVANYEWVKVYINNGNVVAWEQTREIGDNLYRTAIEAYAKAYQLDPKQEAKIMTGLKSITDALLMAGEVQMTTGKYAEAAQSYADALLAQTITPNQQPNPRVSLHRRLSDDRRCFAEERDRSRGCRRFVRTGREQYLKTALDAGFKDEDGNIYYYLFHCYYGQKSKGADVYFPKAKEALLEGIKLYPKNEKILDGLMQFYTAEEGVGDPAELVSMIDATLANDPDSYDLWFGRGRVYFKLQNYDECIASFKRCTELRPDDFQSNFYTGYFFIEEGQRHARRAEQERQHVESGLQRSRSRYQQRLCRGYSVVGEGTRAQLIGCRYCRVLEEHLLPSARRGHAVEVREVQRDLQNDDGTITYPGAVASGSLLLYIVS